MSLKKSQALILTLVLGFTSVFALSGCVLMNQLQNGPPRENYESDSQESTSGSNSESAPAESTPKTQASAARMESKAKPQQAGLATVKSSPSDEEQAASGVIYGDAKGLRQCFLSNPTSWKKEAIDNAVWLKVKISPAGKAVSFQDGPGTEADPVLRQCLGSRLRVLNFAQHEEAITAHVNFRFDK